MKLGKTATLDGLEVIAVKNVIASTQNNATQTVVNAEVNVFQVTWDPTAIKNAPEASMARDVQKPVTAAMYTHVIALMGPASLAVPPVIQARSAARSVPKAPLDETVSRNAQQHVEMLLVTASMEAVPMDV